MRTVPHHVGIILDGNRRWATAKGLRSLKGHLQGYKNFHDIGRYLLLDKQIPYVSAYVFSTENWSRTEEEVGYLMKLVTRALNEYLEEFHRDNVRIVVLGSRDRLSESVLAAIDKAESTTASNTGGTLALCFNYGGQQEIIDAAISAQKAGVALTTEQFAQHVYHPDIPPIDLLIRTSGERRLSGFMLWRAAYAELYFSDVLWPDFTQQHIDAALDDFASRQRRFGS